jgi:hypothetical protein
LRWQFLAVFDTRMAPCGSLPLRPGSLAQQTLPRSPHPLSQACPAQPSRCRSTAVYGGGGPSPVHHGVVRRILVVLGSALYEKAHRFDRNRRSSHHHTMVQSIDRRLSIDGPARRGSEGITTTASHPPPPPLPPPPPPPPSPAGSSPRCHAIKLPPIPCASPQKLAAVPRKGRLTPFTCKRSLSTPDNVA